MSPDERSDAAVKLRRISENAVFLIADLEANLSTRQVLGETCAAVAVLAEVLAAVLEDQRERL